MQFTSRQLAIYTVVVAALGGWLTRTSMPIVKTVVQEKEVLRTDTRTIVRTVKRPDGTIERVRESTDRSTSVLTANSTVTVAKQTQWLLSGGVSTPFSKLEAQYNGSVSKRVVGPIFAGLQGSTNGTIGLLLTMEF